MPLVVAALCIWGLVLIAWYAHRTAPMGYVKRAHEAEQRVTELEIEVAWLEKREVLWSDMQTRDLEKIRDLEKRLANLMERTCVLWLIEVM